MPEKPFVDEFIEFVLDSTGSLVIEREPDGIPQCPYNNCMDFFPVIDSLQAVQIAKNEGFESGIREWEVSFYFFSGDIKDYVWNIRITTYERYEESILVEAGGKSIIIHATTGEVLKVSGWIFIVD